jgi:hypothetical protein
MYGTAGEVVQRVLTGEMGKMERFGSGDQRLSLYVRDLTLK